MTISILGTELTGVMGAAMGICALFIILALIAAAWRPLTGPSLADRVVALDMVTMLLVVFLVVFAMASGTTAYIYAAIALALIGFLATVAFARYIERAAEQEDD
jgi:multicomponent Na+:H+ antiporter subunit F